MQKKIGLIFAILLFINTITAYAAFPNCDKKIIEQLSKGRVTEAKCVQDSKFTQDMIAEETRVNPTTGVKGPYNYYIQMTNGVGGLVHIFTKEQLEMSSVDIEITDGRLIATGLGNDSTELWNIMYARYKTFILGFTGIGTLTCVLVFIILFVKLGGTAGNPTERKKVMSGILVSGIGTAGLGAATIIFGFFYNAI